MISAVVAVLVLPWNLYSNPAVVNYFLGAILGPLFGIMLIDYYLVRRGRVVIDDLFWDDPSGAYYYRRGVNPRALWVFVATALLSCIIALLPSFELAAPFSLVVGAGLAAIAYYYAMRNHPSLARKGLKGVRRSEGAMHGEPTPATDETEAEDEDAAGQHRDSTDGETGTGTSER